MPLDNACAKFHRRHRAFSSAAVQRARDLHRSHRRRIALGAVEHPMQSALADLHRWHIYVEALQQLAQHLALGLDEPLMELAFHALEVLELDPGGWTGIVTC